MSDFRNRNHQYGGRTAPIPPFNPRPNSGGFHRPPPKPAPVIPIDPSTLNLSMDLYDEIRLNEILRALQGDGATPLDDPVFGPNGPMQFDPPSSANDDAYLGLASNTVPSPAQIYERQKIIEWNRELQKMQRPDLRTPVPSFGMLGASSVKGTGLI